VAAERGLGAGDLTASVHERFVAERRAAGRRPRGARAGDSPARASRPGARGTGAPRLPAPSGQPQASSAHRRAALSYSGGITATPAAAHSRAATNHRPTRDTRTARAPTDAPTQHPRPPPTPPLPRLAPQTALRVASTVHPLGSQTRTSSSLVCPVPALACRRPAPGPSAPRLGWPVQVYLDGRGRGVRRAAADPPSSQAQTVSEETP
jgi:hypothetical protein